MNIENFIESQKRELEALNYLNLGYTELYSGFKSEKLKIIFSSLHNLIINTFKSMNERLPTGEHSAHFWAEPSRTLIFAIDMVLDLYRVLHKSEHAFEIESYYFELMKKCQGFLVKSGGSSIPPNMARVDLYYIDPIFISYSIQKVKVGGTEFKYPLKLIAEGSYALIYKFKDEFYNRNFALKRAKSELSVIELERFKREFDEMKELSSPYILEVYRFDEIKSEYIMEYMDCTLDSLIQKSNNKLNFEVRRNISFQILKAFSYLHSKKLIHRDISPKNILIKKYDDIMVVKVSDFGLVKTPESKLTAQNTEFKGYFNDPGLVTEGFGNYRMHHETFALTKLLIYVMTGKTNVSEVKDPKLTSFIKKGLSPVADQRFQNIEEITEAFRLFCSNS